MAEEKIDAPLPAPAPARSSGRLVLLALVVGALAGGGGVWFATPKHDVARETPEKKTIYTCPMHPTYTQDHPGDCPICGMALVRQEDAATDPAGERRVKFYRSPMNPSETSPEPRKDEMGMDYLPVYAEDLPPKDLDVGGLAAVRIDPARQQLIGLRTVAARRGHLSTSWKTVGKIAVDETRVRHINVKVSGYVERIFVDFVGKPVRRGEPLFTLFSPDLLSVQNEFLLAVRSREALQKAGVGAESADLLVDSARQRLRLWDISDGAINELERTGKPSKTLTIYSPISGVVTQKTVYEGHRLAAGDMPYELTDLSSVWVLADAYETDLRKVTVGTKATLSLNAYPDRKFVGRVAFIDPILDARTRTAKVRVAFKNPTGELKPELFGEVTLQTPPRQALQVPADAIIDSGSIKVVFVSLGDGTFLPREVKVGDKDGEAIEVLSGLDDGELVIARANFLVDSESRLKASLAAMGRK